MTLHENEKHEELQHRIEEQEQAMSALLMRVMERPMAPLNQALQNLHSQSTSFHLEELKATQSVEALAEDAKEAQEKHSKKLLNAVADGADRLDRALADLREKEQTKSDKLSTELANLAGQIDHHHLLQKDEINRVSQEIAPQVDRLAAMITQSSTENTRQQEAFFHAHKAMVSAEIYEQVARQLTPLEARLNWIIGGCALSVATTLGLLAVQLLR